MQAHVSRVKFDKKHCNKKQQSPNRVPSASFPLSFQVLFPREIIVRLLFGVFQVLNFLKLPVYITTTCRLAFCCEGSGLWVINSALYLLNRSLLPHYLHFLTIYTSSRVTATFLNKYLSTKKVLQNFRDKRKKIYCSLTIVEIKYLRRFKQNEPVTK